MHRGNINQRVSVIHFIVTSEFDVQLNPVKCSTLTICWERRGLKPPRGETEGKGVEAKTKLTDRKEGQVYKLQTISEEAFGDTRDYLC